MATSVKELSLICGAQLLGGNPDTPIHSAANIDEAKSGQITFVGAAKYAAKLKTTDASAVIVAKGTAADAAPGRSPSAAEHMDVRERPPGKTCLLLAEDPEMAFIACLHHLYPEKPNPGKISAQAQIDATATVGAGTFVDAFVCIGARAALGRNCQVHAGCHIGEDVTLGDGCVLYPNVVLYHGVKLGDNVIIHAGSVIGADGFGYRLRDGKHVNFPQVGIVVIESDVEIGANTCIDRAALGETRIGRGTKIDNQVHIAHNVRIGEHSLLCGQVGIGGSTVIGDYVTLASQCGVADHVKVGDRAIVYAQAGVTKPIAADDQVMGFPAVNRRTALHEMAALRKLAGEQKAVEELIKLLPALRAVLAKERDGE